MNILLLGANGQIGLELLRSLAPLGEVIAATRDGVLVNGSDCMAVDLADPVSLARSLSAANADVIVNAAAYTAVDRAEDEPKRADRVNHRAVAELGAWAAGHGARVIHYSTDYVFDGSATRPYREEDPTASLGVYGRTKLAGDNALRASGAAHLIFRTAWVYASHGHNFLRTMLRAAGEREELRVVADQVGAPTPARWIADTSADALAQWQRAGASASARLGETYNLVASGQCSWYDFAGAIMHGARARGLLARVPRLVPIASADYPTRAQRPAYSVLDCARLESTFGLQLPDWRDGLWSVLDEMGGNTLPAQPSA